MQLILNEGILACPLGCDEASLPPVQALCVYGDFKEAVRHINERIIFIRYRRSAMTFWSVS
jgi:hypothetical protein